jgi:hypothetical protein
MLANPARTTGWSSTTRIRSQEEIKNFSMGHKPRTTSGLYSYLFEEVELRLVESVQVGVGFDVPAYIAANHPGGSGLSDVQAM